jgi:hypothetical protein
LNLLSLPPQEDAGVDVTQEVTDTAQDAIVEALWSAGKPAVWPNCPDHSNTHPLQTDITPSEELVWVCPRSHRVVCVVGALPVE